MAEAYAPRLKARSSEVQGAESQVSLSAQPLFPTLDVGGQALRATANNIAGALFPQAVILPVSGPVRAATSTTASYASAYGGALSWTPITFGRVGAQRNQARASLSLARAASSGAVFDEDVAVATAFLDLVAAREFVRVQEQALVRTDAVARSVRTLALNGLRPGADSLLVNADLSRARIDLVAAQRTSATAGARLGELLDLTGEIPRIETKPWLDTIPTDRIASPATVDLAKHPHAQPFAAQVALSDARENAAALSAVPRVSLVAGFSVRGSGIAADGSVDPGLGAGLSASRTNTAVGLMLTVPVVDALFSAPRAEVERAHAEADRAELVWQEAHLRAQADAADANFRLAMTAAREVPVQLAAATAAYRQMNARYTSGLATLADLAQSQFVLTRAEGDAAIARVAAWRAWLDQCAARGDLAPFLAAIR
jgi:outer membrane protein TolC